MALSEVKRFIEYVKHNREMLEEYNEKLLTSGSYIFSEPTVMTSGYYVSPMLPENLEDELLQKIIQLDEASSHRLKKINEEKGRKISLKDRMLTRFDEVRYKKQLSKEYALSTEEVKRHKLFERLAKLAVEDGFNISVDDLLYYIGKAVLVIIAEHPEYNEIEILDEILNSFD
ncbi:MAG: hypothetical protein ACRCU3_04595 [Eubacteriaceae bacterium]